MCLHLCLSLHLMPHSFFLGPTILSPLLYLDTLPPARPYTGSHLCIGDILINPGFVLLQKRSSLSFRLHINCGVGTQTGIVKYLPIFSLPMLFSHHQLFPLPSTSVLSLVLLWMPPLVPYLTPTSPFYLYLLFSIPSCLSFCCSPAPPHFTLM